jgi:hypothetical protein
MARPSRAVLSSLVSDRRPGSHTAPTANQRHRQGNGATRGETGAEAAGAARVICLCSVGSLALAVAGDLGGHGRLDLSATSTFLSQETSHQQPASSTLLSEKTSTSHQPPANRTG